MYTKEESAPRLYVTLLFDIMIDDLLVDLQNEYFQDGQPFSPNGGSPVAQGFADDVHGISGTHSDLSTFAITSLIIS